VVRYVRVSQNEFASVRKLYESVMSYACHGLFFREGATLADEIIHEIEPGEELLSTARKILISRGWVEDILFTENGARVRGSIEAMPGAQVQTCHRLRGILSRLAELATKKRSRFIEVECMSAGAIECVFAKEES